MLKSIIIPSFLVLLLVSCANTKRSTQFIDEHNSRNALDWSGSYRGVLPCADCEGIQTTIDLKSDGSYTMVSRYLGKPDNVFNTKGNFTWNSQGSQITLTESGSGEKYRYQVGELTLIQLDLKGNKITGKLANRYILSKPAFELYERYWKLTSLNSKPVVANSEYRKEPHLSFKETDNRITGNDGCNSLSGFFDVEGINQIKISNVASTLMACPDGETPRNFLDILQKATHYQINGDVLILSDTQMNPLAEFKEVVRD